MFNIVLANPEIPQNTGNIGRTAYGAYASLSLIRPFSFSLNEKNLRRAGLDYWKNLELRIFDDIEDILESHPRSSLHLFSTRGLKRYDEINYQPGDFLIFGKESRGLEPDILTAYRERTRCLPIPNPEVRSLNLASCVSAVLYEALRQNDFKEPR